MKFSSMARKSIAMQQQIGLGEVGTALALHVGQMETILGKSVSFSGIRISYLCSAVGHTCS